MTVKTKFVCVRCKSEYDTQEQAEACSKTPFFPLDTKYAVDQGRSPRFLYDVRDIEGSGCTQMVHAKPHPLFFSDMRLCGMTKHGNCYPLHRDNTSTWGGKMQPLTPEFARKMLGDLDKAIADRSKYLLDLHGRVALLREYLGENPQEAPTLEQIRIAELEDALFQIHSRLVESMRELNSRKVAGDDLNHQEATVQVLAFGELVRKHGRQEPSDA